MNLEDQLRETLRRREPSLGFAERVAAGVNRATPRSTPRTSRFRWLWAASAVPLAAAAVFSAHLTWQRDREERAGQQAVMALRIASEKLNHTRSKVLARSEVPEHAEGQ